jgi:hypothetical protein
MGVSYGLLRLPKMPEVKEWRERVKKQQERTDTDEAVQASESVEWSDREIDVRSGCVAVEIRFPRS